MDDLGPTRPLVPPLYQSAVYRLPDLDALDRVYSGEDVGFIYARDGHPNARRLANRLAELEAAGWAMMCGSGMAAISAILLAELRQGDVVAASNRLYGRTTQLLTQEAPRFGLTAVLVDANDLLAVEKAVKPGRRMVLVETLSNPLLRVVDVPALAELADAHDCMLVVDNTFATPVLCRPLTLGARLAMESLTKMIGGHSDVSLGLVCGGRAGEEPGDQLAHYASVVSIWGLASPPFDCWLAERSLDTLPLRMRAACENARELADWLAAQPGVGRVLYPGRPDHPDHELSGRLFGGLFGNVLCFDLEGGRDAVNHFLRQAPGVPFSPSLGNTTTTCSHPGSTSHRYVSPAEKKRQGISEGLVRLSVGIEDAAHIRRELARGLASGAA